MIVSCRLRHRFEYTRKSAAFGMPSNRIDIANLTLCGHNNIWGGERGDFDVSIVMKRSPPINSS